MVDLVSSIKNGIKVTMVSDKESYNYGETVKIAFRIDNQNEDVSGAELKIKYYDNLGNSKTITATVGGYGTSTITTPIQILAKDTIHPCFDIESLTLISPSPLISVDKVYISGKLVWEDGEQIAYPVYPIKNGLTLKLTGSREKMYNYFALPVIPVNVSKAVYGNTCTIYYSNVVVESGRSQGELGTTEVLPQGKTTNIQGVHNRTFDDFMIDDLRSVSVNTIYTQYINDGYGSTFTISRDCRAFALLAGGSIEVKLNGKKILTVNSPVYNWYNILTPVKAGDILSFSRPMFALYKSGGVTRIKYYDITFYNAKSSSYHYIKITNNSTPQDLIEIRLDLYSIPDVLVDDYVSYLNSQGVNAFKVNPLGSRS